MKGATIAGLVGVAAQLGIEVIASKRSEMPGYNAAAVAANAKVAALWTGLAFRSAGYVMSGIAGGPPGWVMAGILFTVDLTQTLLGFTSSEGTLSLSTGDVYYDVFSKRGIAWRNTKGGLSSKLSTLSHKSQEDLLLDWLDLNGDGRRDLVIAKANRDSSDFLVATGGTAWDARLTGNLVSWSFGGSDSGPGALSRVKIDSYFKADDVQRGDLRSRNGASGHERRRATGPRSGGFGLVRVNSVVQQRDRVRAPRGSSPPTGTHVLRRVRPRCFRSPAAVCCRGPSTLDKKEGYSVALGNVVVQLGPDIDGNGTPDLIIKDESSYGSVVSEDACLAVTGTTLWSLCENPMPTDPEPEFKGDCDYGVRTWFANFDGSTDRTKIRGEGETMLTSPALEFHSPQTKGIHYVAFNDGYRFGPFVRMTDPLPSFGGSISVVDVTNTSSDVPEGVAMMGSSNFLADPAASGASTCSPSTSRTLTSRTARGPILLAWIRDSASRILSLDAMEAVNLPDGGRISFNYEREVDPEGTLGLALLGY